MFRRLGPRHNPDDSTAGRRGRAKQVNRPGLPDAFGQASAAANGRDDRANREQLVTADAIAADAHIADGLADCKLSATTVGWQAIITM
jgi:hypothetical protein